MMEPMKTDNIIDVSLPGVSYLLNTVTLVILFIVLNTRVILSKLIM